MNELVDLTSNLADSSKAPMAEAAGRQLWSRQDLANAKKALQRQRQGIAKLSRMALRAQAPEPPAVFVSRTVKVRAVLALAITGSMFWVIAFLLLHPPFREHPEMFSWANLMNAALRPWLADQNVLDGVLAAVASWDNLDRLAVEEFLMESVTLQLLSEQNQKGLVVPGATVLVFYLKCWQARGGGALARARCSRLATATATGRKNWLRRFRQRWHVLHAPLLPSSLHAADDSILCKAPCASQ